MTGNKASTQERQCFNEILTTDLFPSVRLLLRPSALRQCECFLGWRLREKCVRDEARGQATETHNSDSFVSINLISFSFVCSAIVSDSIPRSLISSLANNICASFFGRFSLPPNYRCARSSTAYTHTLHTRHYMVVGIGPSKKSRPLAYANEFEFVIEACDWHLHFTIPSTYVRVRVSLMQCQTATVHWQINWN